MEVLHESAISNLKRYAAEFDVVHHIEGIESDIGGFEIEKESYHFIVAVSSLEHLASVTEFDLTLHAMIEGTKNEGIHCIIISTNVTETILDSEEKIEPMYELNFDTDQLVSKLQQLYADWTLLKHTIKPYHTEIVRDGTAILLKGDVVTWAVQKNRRFAE